MGRHLHRLQILAAASTDVSAATTTAATITMSFRPSYRGGRNQPRRNFSDRPQTGGRGQYVSGDSRFRSVRESNLGFRQGESEGLSNQPRAHSPSFGQRPERPRPYNQSQRVPPPHFYQNQQFRPRPPPPLYDYRTQLYPRFPPFGQYHVRGPPQQFRPRPPDYRNWEFAKTPPPPTCERFTVLSYNILADYLAMDHRSKLYYHIPLYMLDWQRRKKNIMFELGLWSADILCLQEVDRFQDFEEELKLRGYSGIWKRRTGIPSDGCAIFWRASRFKLLYEESLEFNKLGLRDNVAQVCVLESMNQDCAKNAEVEHASSKGSNKVVVCNIHVLFNIKRGEMKLGQIRTLLGRAHAVSKFWNDAPVVLCGDFNCVPKSPLYNFISEQKLDLSGVDRGKVSGQASGEIHVQRTYNSNPGVKFGDNSPAVSSVTQSNEDGIKLNEASLGIQKQCNPDSREEGDIIVANNTQPQVINTLNLCDRSSIIEKDEKDDYKLENKVNEEAKQSTIADPKGEKGSISYVPVDRLQEDVSNSEGCSFSGHFNDSSVFVEVYSDPSEIGCIGKVDNSDLELVNQDNSSLPLHEENLSTKAKSDSEPSFQTSFSYALEVSSSENSGIMSNQQHCGDEQSSYSSSFEVDLSYASTSIEVEEKLESLSLNESDEAMKEGGNMAEDRSAFLSALHNTEEALPFDIGQLPRSSEMGFDSSKYFVSSPDDSPQPSSNFAVEDDLMPDLDSEPVDKQFYDPSLWTPVEIEAATGNAECTSLEHPLKLKSTYTEVEDCLGTRDSNGEPLVTSYHRRFMGTVDYIWRSEGLQTVKVLAPIPKHVMQTTPGFPTKKWGSDHIALASELAFVTHHNADVQ
ncbi:hypothetical protein UlMin_035488 [Ulmus minor]